MPIPRRTIVAATLAAILYPWLSSAQEDDDAESKSLRDMTPEERRAAWDAMSEEEKQAITDKRQAAMEKRRAEWEAMTPEERKAKREEMRERMRNMTPEERAAIRERRQRAAQRKRKPGESDRPPRDTHPQNR